MLPSLGALGHLTLCWTKCAVHCSMPSHLWFAVGTHSGRNCALISYVKRDFSVASRKRDSSMPEPEADLTKTYDAVVVGSGAAGGMAAHVLTSHGMKVLLLEAGKKLPIEKELRSMEWPYDNPIVAGYRQTIIPSRINEYTIRRPPYGPGFEKSKHLHSYIGDSDYVKKHRRR